MKDIIRSPLQFVRPMTDHEWQDLVLRANHREHHRLKRQQPQRKLAPIDTTGRRRGVGSALKQTATSASL